MSISLHVIKYREAPLKSSRVEKLAHRILHSEGASNTDINIVLVDDPYIERLNRQFLHTVGPTDVLAFPLGTEGGRIEGEVYISVDTAERQAREYGVALEAELLRLVAHGLLHLLGYEDQTAEQKETMTRREDEYLAWLSAEGENGA